MFCISEWTCSYYMCGVGNLHEVGTLPSVEISGRPPAPQPHPRGHHLAGPPPRHPPVPHRLPGPRPLRPQWPGDLRGRLKSGPPPTPAGLPGCCLPSGLPGCLLLFEECVGIPAPPPPGMSIGQLPAWPRAPLVSLEFSRSTVFAAVMGHLPK